MQRPWRDVTYWLASPGLLNLLSYRTQVYQPRDGTTYNGLGQGWLHPQWAGPFPLDHYLRKCLTAGSHGISSREASFSVKIPTCVKLTQNQPVHLLTVVSNVDILAVSPATCLPVCCWFCVSLTPAGVITEKEPQLRKCLREIQL